MAKKFEEEEGHANSERWLLTYADLITLLMIFFVLMYTISNVNSKKFAQLSASLNQAIVGQNSGAIIGEAPGQVPIPNTPTDKQGGGEGEAAKKEQTDMDKAAKELEAYIQQQGLGGKVVVTQEERGLTVSLKETLLFPIGSADINPDSRQVIHKIGTVLIPMPNSVRIEGHTCNLPISTSQFKSNWELSTTRATNVVEFLITDLNFDPNRLSATGYGEYRPLVPNTSESNRAQNRRVDIVLLKSIYNASEPSE